MGMRAAAAVLLACVCVAWGRTDAAVEVSALYSLLRDGVGCSGGNGTLHLIGCSEGAPIVIVLASPISSSESVSWRNVNADADLAELPCVNTSTSPDGTLIQCSLGNLHDASSDIYQLSLGGIAYPSVSVHVSANMVVDSMRYDPHRCAALAGAGTLMACEVGSHVTLLGRGFAEVSRVDFPTGADAACAGRCEILHRAASRITCRLEFDLGDTCSLDQLPQATVVLRSAVARSEARGMRFAIVDRPRIERLSYAVGCSGAEEALALSDCRNNSVLLFRGKFLTAADADNTVILLSGRGPPAACKVSYASFDSLSCVLQSAGLGRYHVAVATSAGTSEEAASVTLAPLPRLQALSYSGGCGAGEGTLHLTKCSNQSQITLSGIGIGYAEASVQLNNSDCLCGDTSFDPMDRSVLKCILACAGDTPAQELAIAVVLAERTTEPAVIEFVPPPAITKIAGCGAHASGLPFRTCAYGESITIFGSGFDPESTEVHFVAMEQTGPRDTTAGEGDTIAGATDAMLDGTDVGRSHTLRERVLFRPVHFAADETRAADDQPAPLGPQPTPTGSASHRADAAPLDDDAVMRMLPDALQNSPPFLIPLLPAQTSQLRAQTYRSSAVCKVNSVQPDAITCVLNFAGLPQQGVDHYGVYVRSVGGLSISAPRKSLPARDGDAYATSKPAAQLTYADAVQSMAELLTDADERAPVSVPIVVLLPKPYVTFLKGCLRVDDGYCVLRDRHVLALYGGGFTVNPAHFAGALGGGTADAAADVRGGRTWDFGADAGWKALLGSVAVTLQNTHDDDTTHAPADAARGDRPDGAEGGEADGARESAKDMTADAHDTAESAKRHGASVASCEVAALAPHLVLCRMDTRGRHGRFNLRVTTLSGQWLEDASVVLLPTPEVSHISGCQTVHPRDHSPAPPDASEHKFTASELAARALAKLRWGEAAPAANGTSKSPDAASVRPAHKIRSKMTLYCRHNDKLLIAGQGLETRYNLKLTMADGDGTPAAPSGDVQGYEGLLHGSGARFKRLAMQIPESHLEAHRHVFLDGGFANLRAVEDPIFRGPAPAGGFADDSARTGTPTKNAPLSIMHASDAATLQTISAGVLPTTDGPPGLQLKFQHESSAGHVVLRVATDGGVVDMALQVELLPRPVVASLAANCSNGDRGPECTSGAVVQLRGEHLSGASHVTMVQLADDVTADTAGFDEMLENQLVGGDAQIQQAPCMVAAASDGSLQCTLQHTHHTGAYYPVVAAHGGLSKLNAAAGVVLLPKPTIVGLDYSVRGGCLEGNGTLELLGCSSGTAVTIRGRGFGAAPVVRLAVGGAGGTNGPPECAVTWSGPTQIVCVLDHTSAAGGFELIVVDSSGESNKVVVAVIPGNLYLLFKNTRLVLAVSNAVGWVCTCLWTGSFMVLVWSNYKAQSTAGMTSDMVLYNTVGLLGWTVFCCYFYVHDDKGVPVFIQDIVYSLSSYACVVAMIVQFYVYGGSRPSTFSKLYCAAALSYVARIGLENGVTGHYDEVMRAMALIHLACAAVKYAPQAMYNWQRKSTEGYSIFAVWLDFCGAVLLLLQMFFDGVMRHKWSLMITLNVPKFALALEVIFFNTVYAFQHYILYPESSKQKPLAAPLDSPVMSSPVVTPRTPLDSIRKRTPTTLVPMSLDKPFQLL